MALPPNGNLKLVDIAGEFGGAAPHSLSEYYGVANGIPTSGNISISDFYGKSSEIVMQMINPGKYYTESPSGYYRAGSANGNYTGATPSPPADVGALTPDTNGIIPDLAGIVWQLNALTFETRYGSKAMTIKFKNLNDPRAPGDSSWGDATRYTFACPFSEVSISNNAGFINQYQSAAVTFLGSELESMPVANFRYGFWNSQIGWQITNDDRCVIGHSIMQNASLGGLGHNAYLRFKP